MIAITNKEHWLIEQSKSASELLAIITASERINYIQYFEKSFQFFCRLYDIGVRKNDRVGILFNNSKEFLFMVNAIWFCGAVAVPLNIRLTENELLHQIEKIGISFLVIDDKLYNFKKEIPGKIVLLSRLNQLKYTSENYFIHDFDINRDALIMFTSGSTGKSKAVVHTFESIYESTSVLDEFINLTGDDIWLASLPFYHIGGFMIFCRSLISKSKIAIPNSLNYDDIRTAIQKFEPTHISFVSTTLYRLIEEKFKPKKNIKYVFLGGGPLDTSLCDNAIKEGWNIVKVYGSTETCSMVTALISKDYILKPKSTGKPLKNVDIKIIGSKGEFLNTHEKGEIAIKSKTLFREYLSSENRGRNVDEYFLTGDYGWLDEDGYLYIDSRREDIIITGGENVSIKEVENAIKQLNEVEDVYVFPEKDKEWGQLISAAIVLNNEKTLSEIKRELISYIASYKIPKRFYFVEKIPRTELGKIDKEKLIKLIKEQ
ncbi:MAG: o-succinylbenzoate--CoA ligase [Melioribacter sp.]|uniref:o-succinylbenzoate--CoA ligase n=1 Tax=Rosettibacter primus TaxID=3111523 RepID=UPI00247E8323|nr:o-succinylbenzoate--CoA ligase [Melioribacter sp.]